VDFVVNRTCPQDEIISPKWPRLITAAIDRARRAVEAARRPLSFGIVNGQAKTVERSRCGAAREARGDLAKSHPAAGQPG